MTPDEIRKLPTPETESILTSLGFVGSDAKIAKAMRSLEQQRDAAVMALERIRFLDGYDGCYLYRDARSILNETLASLRSMK